jgi:hypothetical protein
VFVAQTRESVDVKLVICKDHEVLEVLRISTGVTGVRYAANTIEEMQKLLLGYRDNMRVEIATGIAVTAKTVADLRALPAWPNGLVLNIHVDLDPRFSIVRVERAS